MAKYCSNCGAEVTEEQDVCLNCGTELHKKEEVQKVNDSGSFGWAVLGFLIPLVGLILFCSWKGSKPLSAKKAGIGALVGFIFNIIVEVIYFATLGGATPY